MDPNWLNNFALPPVCTKGGPIHKYYAAPMVQAGATFGTKPWLGNAYARKECSDTKCNSDTKCRMCFLALANRAPDGSYLNVDTTPGNNWVRMGGFTAPVAKLGMDSLFRALYDSSNNYVGFEACAPWDVSQGGITPTSTSVQFDVHGSSSGLHLAVRTCLDVARPDDASQTPQTATLSNTGIFEFKVPACTPAAACVPPATALVLTGTPAEVPGAACGSTTADYKVTLTATEAPTITTPATCTLTNDARNAAGTGTVDYTCTALKRGETTSLVFTGTSAPGTDPACAKSVPVTVTITPTASETFALTIAPTSDKVCPGAKGRLVFTVSASPAVTAAQVAAATATLTSEATSTSTACAKSGSGATFTVTCDGVAPSGTSGYKLEVSLPGVLYPSCTWSAPALTGIKVLEYDVPVLTATVAPTSANICPGATAAFTIDVTVSAPYIAPLVVHGGGATCTLQGTKIQCTTSAPATVKVSAKFGDAAAGDNCATTPTSVPLPVNVDSSITVTTITPTSDKVCPADSVTGTISFVVALSAPAGDLVATLVNAKDASPVVGASCTKDGSNAVAWKVSCAVPPGQYALKVTPVSTQGCQYPAPVDTTVTATVSTFTPPTLSLTQPDPKTVCAGGAAVFEVPLPALTGDLKSIDFDNKADCKIQDSKLICTLTASKTVALTAHYGDGTHDCTLAPVSLTFTVKTDPVISVTSVTPTSDDVCPASNAKGSVSFAVTTSAAAASVAGTLLDSSSKQPVAGATCAVTGSLTKWTVACSSVPVGSYVLQVSSTSALGCANGPSTDASAVATVATYPKPKFTFTPPPAQSVCTGSLAKFTVPFTVSPTPKSVAASNTDDCTLDATAGTLTCSVGTTTTVKLTAKFGVGTDDCTSGPAEVVLTVNPEAITLASITPTVPTVCPPASPTGTTGVLTFAVTTSGPVKSLTPALLLSAGGAAPGVTCTAPGADKAAWTVTCPGVSAGNYKLQLSATSALGCKYDFGSSVTGAAASVGTYAYTINAGPDISAQTCAAEALGSQLITVTLSNDLVGATVTATAYNPAVVCSVQSASGATVLVGCSGLPGAGAVTTITVTATKSGCALSDAATVTVTQKAPSACLPPADACYSRTLGYYGSHGDEVAKWLTKAGPFPLWGKSFTGLGCTTSKTTDTSAAACTPADAIRVMCVPGQSVCSDAQLARQCLAALINVAITNNCGKSATCYQAGYRFEKLQDNMAACCGPTSKPAPTAMAACITAIDDWNQDKVGITTCAYAPLPGGGPATTNKACNDYSNTFGTTTCTKGFCAARRRQLML